MMIVLANLTFMLPQFEAALDNLRNLHLVRLTTYKRLLERAQASSAAQAYALQAEVSILKDRLQSDKQTGFARDSGEICMCGGWKVKGYWSGYDGEFTDESFGLADALNQGGKGVFDEKQVSRAVRRLGREARMRM